MHSVLWTQQKGQAAKRQLVTLVAALVLALATTYSPVVLDGLSGSTLTSTAAACPAHGGGC